MAKQQQLKPVMVQRVTGKVIDCLHLRRRKRYGFEIGDFVAGILFFH